MTHAAVIINEVSWMGDSSSANHEWIELYNNGTAAVDVSDWTFSDGMNLNVELSGVIPASSYVVLERTSDESAAGAAFLIYTGALVNTGATLVLKRADGSIEDQVSGGENWESIGGDNVTKETAQYTSGGWITAAATPGALNASVGTIKEVKSNQLTSGSGSSNGVKAKRIIPADETVRLILPGITLDLDIDAQEIGYVNQPILFKVTPSGIGKTLLDSLTYEWNFGDGEVGKMNEVSHSFAFPGTYVTTVYGSYKRQEQAARHEITILPVSISLTRSKLGDLQINNDSPYEIDISGYKIVGTKTFMFPARSILLANQTVTIKLSKIGTRAAVYDQAGNEVVSESKIVSPVTAEQPLAFSTYSAPAPQIAVGATKGNSNFNFAPIESDLDPVEVIVATSSFDETAYSTTSPISSRSSNNRLPYLGLMGVLAVGTMGVLYKPNRNQN